jgi:hypothetical protein
VARGTANRSQRIAIVREKTMKSRNQNMPAGIRSDIPEETGKNRPSLAEIHKRALEIHVERGRHFCDLDNYLDEWLQAEGELKDKYNTSNNEGAKNQRDGCQNDHGCDPVPARSKEAGEHRLSEGNAYERRKSHVLGS